MPTLTIAAGGGGDAITSAALAVRNPDDPQVIMTYSWDRLLIDPLPGPRAAHDFDGLHELAPIVWEVLGTTSPVPPAGSTLPRLAAELPVQILLLDPSGGTVRLAQQITAAAGGKMLAERSVPELPLTLRLEGLRPEAALRRVVAVAALRQPGLTYARAGDRFVVYRTDFL